MNRILLFVCLIVLLLPLNTYAEEPEVRGDGAIVIDSSGEVLYEKNSMSPLAPASLIKLLNIITARPYLDLNEAVTVSPLADTVYNGQMMDVSAGDVIEVRELLYGMMLHSANDGALALAAYLLDDLHLYAALMDQKAWALGAVHTTSVNVNGYSDPAQLTCAYDLALIAAAYLADGELAAIGRSEYHILTWIYPEHEREIANINRFLFSYEGACGLKTGTTALAGKCLIAAAEREGRLLIAVTLNSSDRYGDCTSMLDYAFVSSGA